MKARQGFVSNSSSSSFCILGCVVTEKIHKIAKAKYEEVAEKQVSTIWCCSKCEFISEDPDKRPKFCEDCGSLMGEKTVQVPVGAANDRSMFKKIGLDLYSDAYGEDEVVGINVRYKSSDQIAKINEILVDTLEQNDFQIIADEYEY